jgi:hypothetical protein
VDGIHLNSARLEKGFSKSKHTMTHPGSGLNLTVSATRTTSTIRPSIIFATLIIVYSFVAVYVNIIANRALLVNQKK